MNKGLFQDKLRSLKEKFESHFQMDSMNICVMLMILILVGAVSVFTIYKSERLNGTRVAAHTLASPDKKKPRPQNKLVYSEKVGVPILMYHKIATEDKFEGVPNNMVVTPQELESQLAFLQDQGYDAISYQDLYDYIVNKKPIPERSFIISFDDGYESNYEYLPALMKKLGMKAEIAIVTGLPRKVDGSVTNGASYFTWKHANELQRSGLINLESHTANHANLAKTKILDIELGGAIDDMEKYMGKRPNVIVYPGGSYSSKVIKRAQEYGYQMGVTIEQGINYPNQDVMKIKRFVISHGETGQEILNRFNKFKRK